MFGKQKKSYSESDVYTLAMEWREIEDSADCGIPAGGLVEWAKIENNKKKLYKNFGIQHGFIKGKFKGKSEDFDDFFEEVVIKTHNRGFSMNFGKSIYKQHKSLIKKMDEDYFSGIKLGVDQALTGKTHYQDYQKELFGPSGILIPAKEYEGASTDDGMNVLDLGTTQSPPADKEDAEMEAKIESFYKNKTEPFPSFVYFFFFAVILLMLIEFFDSLIF